VASTPEVISASTSGAREPPPAAIVAAVTECIVNTIPV
jgi:hypothetical protein